MRKTVFIVDDHAAVRRVLKMGIEAAGYAVAASANGAECLLRLCDETPDFLVTDVDMPRMNGKELCDAIDKQFPERQFPIVVLTSRTERELRDWTSSLRDIDFMEKPVSIKKLVATIDRALDVAAVAS